MVRCCVHTRSPELPTSVIVLDYPTTFGLIIITYMQWERHLKQRNTSQVRIVIDLIMYQYRLAGVKTIKLRSRF
jgi:hypothetical protein